MKLAPPDRAAARAGLHYVSDSEPGIRRKRSGKGFSYQRGRRTLKDPSTLERIAKLAIPPAWKTSGSAPTKPATSKPPAATRAAATAPLSSKIPRSPRQRQIRRPIAFGKALPKVRAAIARDRRKQGLPREKVLATVAHLWI